MNNKYLERAKKLSEAAVIAEKIVNNSSNLPASIKKDLLKIAADTKEWALHPEPKFMNLTSLSYLENDFFTYWNEEVNQDIEEFWKKLKLSGLEFQRKDIFKEVLKRKKIKNIHEYNHIVDGFIIAQQTDKITKEEADILNQFIGDFEKKHSKKIK